MKRSIILASILGAALGLTGCNTVSGAGKDVSSAGKAITKAAEPVR